jgi:hypothetical protein
MTCTSQRRKLQLLGSVQNMGEGGRWAAMSVAIAGYMAARMTKPKSAEVQGPEVPVPRFLAGRRTCSLRPCATPLRRCCATHARASISSGQQEGKKAGLQCFRQFLPAV